MNSREIDKKAMEDLNILGLLDTVPVFNSLNHKESRILARQLFIYECFAGETLFREGDRGDSLFFVADGTLEVVKASKVSSDVVISTVGKGRTIGEMSVIDEYPRSATVQARTRTTLIVLRRDRFEKILADHPRIGIKILKGITRLISLNLRKTSSRLVDYMLPMN